MDDEYGDGAGRQKASQPEEGYGMTSKSLVLCVHAHQPVGNFDGVFLEAYEKAYRPFFEVLRRHPSIPVSCHLSGSLIEWLQRHRPAFLRMLRPMCERGQLEFLGGAYYEPIYGVIPPRDLTGQIQLMRNKLEELFGQEPPGAWITERVWDPELVRPLSEAGVKYTVLDDFHLEKAGAVSPVTGYYSAREGGHTLDVFASMQPLRYLIPFRPPEEVLRHLESLPASSEDAIVFADDCEKFGLWPRTFGWVYGNGWLEKMLTILENQRNITLYTLGGFQKRFKSKGFVRIPHASYQEMMEWSGGNFYNFFERYPESRYMRDRMWNTSGALVRAVANNGHANDASGDFQKAREALYRAQCNCTYWHGVFGGLYSHHLRSTIFENLIQAEILIRKHPAGESGTLPSVDAEKLGSDKRWRIHQAGLVSYFYQGYGAALEELDYLPKTVNLMCNLARRKEPYHETVLNVRAPLVGAQTWRAPAWPAGRQGPPLQSIHTILGVKDKGLRKNLHYDMAMRHSFMDHFLEAPASSRDLRLCRYREIGDFIGARYKSRLIAPHLQFKREGMLLIEGRPRPLALIKRVFPEGDSSIRVSYCLRNTGPGEIRFVFGVEFNFSIKDPAAAKGFFKEGIRSWDLRDAWRRITIQLASSEPVDITTAPVETVSGSERGLERTYQGVCVFLQRSLTLESSAEAEHEFLLSVTDDDTQQTNSN